MTQTIYKNNSSTANVYPRFEIWGPGKLWILKNNSTDKAIWFSGLTLQPGERVMMDLNPTEVSMTSSWSGRGNVLRYVGAGSDIGDFTMKPGMNNISIFIDNSDSSTRVMIRWTPLFWGIDGAVLV